MKKKPFDETSKGTLVYLALKNMPTKNLLNFCFDSDRDVSLTAITQCSFRPEEIVFEAARKACYSLDYKKIDIGLAILSQLGVNNFPYKSDTFPILKRLIDHHTLTIKNSVLITIGKLYADDLLEDRELIDKIIELKNSENINLLSNIAFALGSCKPSKRVIETLEFLFNYNNTDVSDWAKISLQYMSGG